MTPAFHAARCWYSPSRDGIDAAIDAMVLGVEVV